MKECCKCFAVLKFHTFLLVNIWKKIVQHSYLQKVKSGHEMKDIIYIGKYDELFGEKYLVEKVQVFSFYIY